MFCKFHVVSMSRPQVEAVYEIKLDDLVETEVDDSGTIQRDGDRIGGTAAYNDRLEGATVNGSAGDIGSNVDGEWKLGKLWEC